MANKIANELLGFNENLEKVRLERCRSKVEVKKDQLPKLL
jgi:hypothetical protein